MFKNRFAIILHNVHNYRKNIYLALGPYFHAMGHKGMGCMNIYRKIYPAKVGPLSYCIFKFSHRAVAQLVRQV